MPKWFRGLTPLGRILVILAGLLVFWLVYIPLPTWIVSATLDGGTLTTDQWLTAVAAQRQGVLFVFGGVIAIYGVWLNVQRQSLGETTGRSDRYANAVANLASESTEIRTAGIYLLEQVMIDPHARPQERINISEVLCAFIREHSERLYLHETDELRRAKSDVRAAAQVLARRPSEFSYPAVDLTGADLSGIDLAGADFRRGVLREVRFVECELANANFNGADLLESFFVRARLDSADLSSAYAHAADFRGARIVGVDFTGANIASGNFSGADLTEATMDATNATHAVFDGADFKDAHGINADFGQATMQDIRNWGDANFRQVGGEPKPPDRRPILS